MNWWLRQSETVRWTLYLPTLIVISLLLVILLQGLLDGRMYDVQNISGAIVFAIVSNKLSMWLAPRWKKQITVLVTSPIHLASILAIIIKAIGGTLINIPNWSGFQNSDSDVVWSAAWLMTSFVVLVWRDRS